MSELVSFCPFEYQEAGLPAAMLALETEPGGADVEGDQGDAQLIIQGIAEEEVVRREMVAREEAKAEAELRLRAVFEAQLRTIERSTAEAVAKFDQERSRYFQTVEGEVVQLALLVARKILQRETELDPAWLAALVRVALDKMRCGSAVRIRVKPSEVATWTTFAEQMCSENAWEVVGDNDLATGDCVVETELGTAQFGVEAQLRDVETGFRQLLAQKPDGV